MTFTREPRYIVLKSTDVKAALTQTDQEILEILCDKVARWRISHDKANLSGVFVEHDWPEHDGVWAAIEQRVSGETATPVPWPRPYPPKKLLLWPGLVCEHDWVVCSGNGKPYHTCTFCKKSEEVTL